MRNTSPAFTELFSRVSFSRSDAVIAYLGLDPRPCDSGPRRGRRRLSKRGPAELRRLLYNAARSAAQTATWKPCYERQRAPRACPPPPPSWYSLANWCA